MRPNFKEINIEAAVAEKHAAPASKGQEAEWITAELIPVKHVYTESDLEGLEHLDYVSGLPPFLKGRIARCILCVPGQSVSMLGFSTAAESNAFYRRNLASGQKGLSVAFDLPTHRGYDADHERVVGDVGKV